MSMVWRWLWYLLPANPVLVRVVEGGSRRLRHLWVRMGYLGVLILLMMIGLLSGGGMASNVNLNDLAKAGGTVFALVAYGQVILVCLLAPLFMAGAIDQDRSGRTMDILLTTPLSNLQIVLGSLLGRLYFVLALLASGLPLFAVLLIFGGVPVRSIFAAFTVAALTALIVGAVAVTLAVLRKGGRKAVFIFIIAIAAYLVGIYAADWVWRLAPAAPSAGSSLFVTGAGRTTWLTPLHPLLVLEVALSSASYRPPTADEVAHLTWPLRFYLAQPLAAFAAWTWLLSLLLVLWSAVQLRQAGQARANRTSLTAWLIRRANLGRPAAFRQLRSVWANPVAWREAQTRGNRLAGILARWSFVLLGLAAAALLIGFYHIGRLPSLHHPLSGGAMSQSQVFHILLQSLLLLELTIIVLVALYMSAGSVSREREDGTLDLLLTTPITPEQYLWGKVRGLVGFLVHLLAVPLLTLAAASVYVLVGQMRQWPQATATYPLPGAAGTARFDLLLPEVALLWPIMLVPFVALCVAVGMSWSLKAKRVLGAVTPAVGIVGAVVLTLGFCGYHFAAGVPFLGPLVNAFSPTTNLLMLLNPWEHVSSFAAAPTAGRMSLAFAALIAGGGYSLIVYSLLTSMIRSFDQTVRRLTGT